MDITTILAQSANAAADIGPMHVDIVKALKDSDFMGILCVSGCVLLSIISWVVILYKWKVIREAMTQSDRFDKVLDSTGSFQEALKKASNYPSSPLAKIFREAYLEIEGENWYEDINGTLDEKLTVARLTVERVMEKTISHELGRLESHLIVLATTTNVAPFVGLFGTVWGVLAAFQALSNTGSAALAALAPGMSTALVATIAGLVAAIPASIFYNYLTNKIAILTSRMDSFALELANILQREVIRKSSDY